MSNPDEIEKFWTLPKKFNLSCFTDPYIMAFAILTKWNLIIILFKNIKIEFIINKY